ncbi:hypothetical protein Actkin_04359 [Actinokineospora sp. UTMC 2448]|nr:hypothetical protein Actkin_04359 [Actinokineospora sp. UTMC 2448]
MLDFPKDPSVVYLELHGSSVYLHEPAVDLYARVREELRRAACSVADTRSVLKRFVGQL